MHLAFHFILTLTWLKTVSKCGTTSINVAYLFYYYVFYSISWVTDIERLGHESYTSLGCSRTVYRWQIKLSLFYTHTHTHTHEHTHTRARTRTHKCVTQCRSVRTYLVQVYSTLLFIAHFLLFVYKHITRIRTTVYCKFSEAGV